MAGAIAPATALRCPVASRGPKPPASARPVTGGRFAPAGLGAGLCRSRTCRSTGHRRAGAGKSGAFPVPARRSVLQDARSLWQGPSPLPQRYVAPWPAGGQSPRPAPAPPTAGASRPPGRALACRVPGPAGLRGTVARGRGNAVRFLSPPALTKAVSPLQWQGQSPLPQRCAGIRTSRGPSPPASARPVTGGHWPALRLPERSSCGGGL